MNRLHRTWRVTKVIANKVGDVQARLMLTLFYCVVLLPFGLAARLFSDRLRTKRRPTQWLQRPVDTYDSRWAKRQ